MELQDDEEVGAGARRALSGARCMACLRSSGAQYRAAERGVKPRDRLSACDAGPRTRRRPSPRARPRRASAPRPRRLLLAVADAPACRGSGPARRRGSSCRPTRSARRPRPGRRPRAARPATRRGVLGVAVGDRQHDRLHRRQPDREAAGVVLDQDPGEALHRAEQGAVDHHRAVRRVVGAGVGEVEALGHLEVELAGAALPGAAERVGDVEVDLRPVEGAVAGVELVLAALALERLASAPPRPAPTAPRCRSTSPAGSRARPARPRSRSARRARRSPRRCRSPRRRSAPRCSRRGRRPG